MVGSTGIAAVAVGPALIGLSTAEADRRRAVEGRNVLPAPPSTPAWRRLGRQMVSFFAVMLWVAAGLALIAGMPVLAYAIAGVVVINGTFAFAQEYRAERAAASLRDLLPRRAVVVRDGRRNELDASELVVGDLSLLAPGDRVSADMEVLEAEALTLDLSTLTGESEPVPIGAGGEVPAGCFVVEGEASCEVTAIGASTRLAGIAALSSTESRPMSPLTRELNRVVRIIAVVAVGIGASFFGLSVLVGGSARSGLLFAIGVTVALVPEGLLPTVTLSLAGAAQRMAHRSALVRRIESVETLGSTTFICSDKTGTITANRMSVQSVWTPTGTGEVQGQGYDPTGEVVASPAATESIRATALAASRCSDGQAIELEGAWVAEGDPTEVALDVLARRCGLDLAADAVARPERRRWPFDARRKRMSVLVGDQLIVKGAPESVLDLCTPVSGASEAVTELAGQGLRVLAVAGRPCRATDLDPDSDAEEVEHELELVGLCGLEDPPRPSVGAAIGSCRAAGIKIAMLTGDHPATAAAIAHQVGLLDGDSLVVDGQSLPEEDAVLGALLDHDGVVVARVTPEGKLRIAQALQHRGHVVAMTGDGVNDGPALQTADIGVAMGRSGTDVAREAADLVLLDDDFSTIVAAVELGRVTFSNMRRFLTYHLTANCAELTPFVVWALSGGRFPLALGVLQILCFDVGADVVPALGLGLEPPSGALLAPLTNRHLIDRSLMVRVFGVLGPAEALWTMAAFGVALAVGGWVPGHPVPHGPAELAASGTAFATVILGQVAVAFACRSATRTPWRLGWTSNRLLLIGVGTAVVLMACFLAIPAVASLLGQAPPPPAGWVMACLALPLMLSVDAVHKAVRRHRRPGPGPVQPRGFGTLPGGPLVTPAGARRRPRPTAPGDPIPADGGSVVPR